MAEPGTVSRLVTLSKDEQEYVWELLHLPPHYSTRVKGHYVTPLNASLCWPCSH